MNDARKKGNFARKPLESFDFFEPRAGTTDEEPYKLLIVSDIRFLREVLAETLARDGAFKVAGAFAHVGDALCISRTCGVQIILIDAALPDGLVAARRFRDLGSRTHVVALALSETEAEVLAWAEAGATGYIPRSVALCDFGAFLKEVVRGQQACSTRVAASLIRWVSRASIANSASSPAAAAPALTGREEQVVGLICAGLSNKEISRRLNIGLATTKSHIHNLLSKLALQRRGQVLRWMRDHAPDFVDRVTLTNNVSTASQPLPPPSDSRMVDSYPARTRPL